MNEFKSPGGASPEEQEYEGLDMLFSDENLGESFDAVKTQLDSLRGLILDLGETREKHATDPDQDQYVDALEEQVANGFKKFKINTKEVDIGSLAGEGAWEDKYNAIVNEINRYKELYMIGSGKRDVEGI
jgi:hypothetical protein